MAALTCSLCAPAAATASTSSWQDAPAKRGVEAVAAEEDAAAYAEATRRLRSKIASRRRSKEGGGGEEEEVWEGAARREIRAGVEEVWDMVGKFSGMKRWNPIVEVCEVVEGKEEEVGCVRYCTGGGRWVKEKLLEMNATQRCFTYTMLEGSYGFQGYVATLAIEPLCASRTVAHWTFRLEPVAHLTQSKLLDLLTFIFDRMMGSLEDTILSSSDAPGVAD